MTKADIKVGLRYLIIAFFIWLAYDITRPSYIQQIKGLGEVGVSAVYASVFGSLSWIIKSNWGTSPTDKGA